MTSPTFAKGLALHGLASASQGHSEWAKNLPVLTVRAFVIVVSTSAVALPGVLTRFFNRRSSVRRSAMPFLVYVSAPSAYIIASYFENILSYCIRPRVFLTPEFGQTRSSDLAIVLLRSPVSRIRTPLTCDHRRVRMFSSSQIRSALSPPDTPTGQCRGAERRRVSGCTVM